MTRHCHEKRLKYPSLIIASKWRNAKPALILWEGAKAAGLSKEGTAHRPTCMVYQLRHSIHFHLCGNRRLIADMIDCFSSLAFLVANALVI